MSNCSHCKTLACSRMEVEDLPKGCPMGRNPAAFEQAAAHMDEEMELGAWAARIEARGYCHWTRMEEIMELARGMGYSHLGIAFCAGLHQEARTATDILRSNGFRVSSVICKTGAVEKARLSLDEEDKLRPGQPEAMCYPIAQAEVLNELGSEFNITVGLCVGHDSLFFRYSQSPATVLVAKDRVLAHNPVGALYCASSYYRRLTNR